MKPRRYRATSDTALDIFRRAPVVHIAAVKPDGQPILRTVHGVVMDGAIAFHAGPKGEKAPMAGWPAVVNVEELVAEIPSHFVHPERACPATTYYLSAQAKGRFEQVEAPAGKARVLQALMERLQPEGGHQPITDDDPMYEAAVRGIRIFRLPLEDVTAKVKLGQNRSPEDMQGILRSLWRRGDARDLSAIETIIAHRPETRPAFLRGPDGTELVVRPAAEEAAAAAALVEGQYWNVGVSEAELTAAHARSDVWVGARETSSGALIASARALTDGAKIAMIFDVAVAPQWRGRGVGSRVFELLLDHASVRSARRALLRTKDAHRFYERFGFRVGDEGRHDLLLRPRPDIGQPDPDFERSASNTGRMV